ncbi:hypothetical protein P4C99_08435 [Pontiellaceae bacterium B1224]|nr:hypothetical protein [Pontiellaceae bacterium B1224]
MIRRALIRRPLTPSWETAAANIEDAVGAALPSNTVLVADGYYTLLNTITLPGYSRLESVAGPDVTYIEDPPDKVYIDLPENGHISGFSVMVPLEVAVA